MSTTIIFIHGMFNNSKAWQNWISYFQERGFQTHALDWPLHEGEPAQLRKSPNPKLGELTFTQVKDHLKAKIMAIDPKAVLVGHSMGGLLVQKLISEGVGSSAVCISSVAPVGVVAVSLNMLKSCLPVFNLFALKKPYVMSESHFKFSFCNTLSGAESKKMYDLYLVPESRMIAVTAAGLSSKISFKKPHAPIFFISGKKDNFMPTALNRSNANAYRDQDSIVGFKAFDNRDHSICGAPGWEEVAKAVENFLDRLK